jgi:hypothetical protein
MVMEMKIRNLNKTDILLILGIGPFFMGAIGFAAVCEVIWIILFQTYQNRPLLDTGQIPFDISLGIVLVIMLMVKVLSVIYEGVSSILTLSCCTLKLLQKKSN